MSNLIVIRGQFKCMLTRFWNYISTADNDINQIHVWKERIEEVWHEFNQIQFELEIEGSGNIDEQYQYGEKFEELYYKAVTEANRRLQWPENKIDINKGQNEYNPEESDCKKSRKVVPGDLDCLKRACIFGCLYWMCVILWHIYRVDP